MNATSETIGKISAALAKAQGAMVPALIDGKATVEMKSGGKYGYTYASLTSVWEAIRKPLSDNGLAVIQRTDDEGGVIFLYTILAHESGEFITSRLYVGQVGRSAQETGSALTYARRYGLSAIVGVVTDEDDDGAEATKNQKAQPATVKPATAKPAQTGNGAKPTTRPDWHNVDDAVLWGMDQGAFKALPHSQNAYNKLKAEAMASDNPPKNAKDMFDRWFADVTLRLERAKGNTITDAELDAQAASEAPQF